MYHFKDEYRIGIESIDKEHEKLFEIANQAYETLTNDFIPDKYDYIIAILNELKDYAATHFLHEEEYMMGKRYKKFFSQKASHEDFIQKLSEYDLNQIDENQKQAMLDLLEFLNDWLVNHIMKDDKLIGQEA